MVHVSENKDFFLMEKNIQARAKKNENSYKTKNSYLTLVFFYCFQLFKKWTLSLCHKTFTAVITVSVIG
jgi:hypothetical protein